MLPQKGSFQAIKNSNHKIETKPRPLVLSNRFPLTNAPPITTPKPPTGQTNPPTPTSHQQLTYHQHPSSHVVLKRQK